MKIRLLLLITLLMAAGCAGQQVNTAKDTLDPEVSGLEALSQSRGRPLTAAERQALASRPEITFHLTGEESEEVKLFFTYFVRDKHDTVERWLLRSQPNLEYIRAVLMSHRLPQDLMALPYIESGYNVLAMSGSGAAGMWQFMPGTAKRFGLTVDWWLDERRDPYLSTVAAARYLKTLHEQFGDWQLALAAYNAGEGGIARAMTHSGAHSFKALAQDGSLRDETRHYVPKFLAMLKVLQNAKKLGFTSPDLRASRDLQEVRIPPGSDLAGLAEHVDLNWEQFHALNPAFRRMVSPPDRTTAAWLPKGQVQRAEAWLERPPRGAGAAVRLARAGDTWWTLSRETGVPVGALREANQNADKPNPGNAVLLPLAACSLDCSPYEQKNSPVYAGASGPSSQAYAGQPTPHANAAAPAASPSHPTYASVSAAPPALPTLYVVHKGDTLASVAQKTGFSVQDLAAFNKANPKEPLVPGTPLLIPPKGNAGAEALEEKPITPAKTYDFKVIRRTGT
jgi:membrane-bound lytic murein transglycosylase D